jgi:hypothetical protein
MRIARPAVVTALFLLLAASVPLRAYAPQEENSQIAQLLDDANSEAIELASDADDMETMIRSDTNWVNHALALAKIKGHVDTLDLIMNKLVKMQGSGSDLQQQAIQQMMPLVKELSENTTAALNYLNQRKSRPISETYTKYLRRNAETAHQLSSMISSLVDYEKSMTDVQRLRNTLESSPQ